MNENLETILEEIWTLFPRKTAKQDALKALTARLRAGESAENISTATANYAKSREGQDPHYTMLGSTFFGPSKRYEDYIDPAGPAMASSTPQPASDPPGLRRDYAWSDEYRAERDREVAGMFRPEMAVLRPKMSESTQAEGRRWIDLLREEHNLTRSPRSGS
jgi:hypothetical protein